MKFFSVSAPKPCQFVNDRPIEAIVGSQMKERHRKVGIPTISAIVSLSRRVRIENSRLLARLTATAPPGGGPGRAVLEAAGPDTASG